MTLLLVYAVLAIGVSFLCSLLEAALLSLPRSRVEALVAQGSPAGLSMKGLKDNIERPLAAILTFNTIAHTVGAAGVGAQAAMTFGDAAVGVASAVMTLAILVLSEIIPKTLGAVHADRLVGITAYTTRAMIVLCLPLIVPLEWLNRLIGHQGHHDRISRFEVLATVRLGHRAGALRERDLRVVTNVMSLESVRLNEILTPRVVLFALPATETIGAAAQMQPPIRYSRVPIYEGTIENIVGYVTRYDIMTAAGRGRGDEPLTTLKRPILILPELASVADALDQLLVKHAHIAAVVDEHGGIEGIITLEDVIETLLGREIVDETDSVKDLQRLARWMEHRRSKTLRPLR
ncbi:MAG: DUF21 domain-containing protein [Phycisphaerales bacterium]|nr:DUF21 domain-containing protein [Phycisphaerales bacterium]